MIALSELLKAGIHFGHRTSRWSPRMRPYIWGSRNNIHLIDISKTAFLLERAGKFLQQLASEGKPVLWVGTKRPAQKIVKQLAEQTKMPCVIHRWIGGTLTNNDQIKKAVTRLLHLRDVVEKSINQYGKKEQSMLTKEVARLEKSVGGIVDGEFPPGAVVIVDARKERSAVKEAICTSLPIVAMVDTNTDPTGISYVIPSNDDSPRAISFVMEYLGACVVAGQKEFEKTKKVKKTEGIEEKAAKLEAGRKQEPELQTGGAAGAASDGGSVEEAQVAEGLTPEGKEAVEAPPLKTTAVKEKVPAKAAAKTAVKASAKKEEAPAEAAKSETAEAKKAAPKKTVAKTATEKADQPSKTTPRLRSSAATPGQGESGVVHPEPVEGADSGKKTEEKKVAATKTAANAPSKTTVDKEKTAKAADKPPAKTAKADDEKSAKVVKATAKADEKPAKASAKKKTEDK